MDQRSILTALYIRRGIATLNSNVENALFKKKQRKCIITQDQLAKSYSIFNFFEVKHQKLQYFILKEQLKGFTKLGVKAAQHTAAKQREIKQDINQFKILQARIVARPKDNSYTIHQGIKANIIKQQIVRLFSENEVESKLQQTHGALMALKHRLNTVKVLATMGCIDAKMRKIKNRFQAYCEARQLQQQMGRFGKIICEFPSRKEVIEANINKEIAYFIDKLFKKVVDAVKLNDLLTKVKMKKKWDSDLLLKEEQNLVGRKIKGRLLYTVEQDVRKGKDTLHGHHIAKEYFIRQNNNGIHQNIINNHQKHQIPTKKSNRALEYDQDYQQVTRRCSKPAAFSNSAINSKKQRFKEDQAQWDIIAQMQFEKPKSKSQLIQYSRSRFVRPTSHATTQPLKIKQYDANNMAELRNYTNRNCNSKSKQRFSGSSILRQPLQQMKKKYPQGINKANEHKSNGLSSCKQDHKLNEGYQTRHQTRLQKVLKYPIKIQSVEIYSAENSAICYNIEDIALKELSLKFIQDRLKYRQNRVKIYYPYRFSREQEQKVAKAMEILSCLGAQVQCEPECSYQHWNEIDSTDVLVVSWMLQLPLRQTVNYYSQYITSGVPTKK